MKELKKVIKIIKGTRFFIEEGVTHTGKLKDYSLRTWSTFYLDFIRGCIKEDFNWYREKPNYTKQVGKSKIVKRKANVNLVEIIDDRGTNRILFLSYKGGIYKREL